MVSQQPILTDRLASANNNTSVASAGGAHMYSGKLKSCNSTFGDGHTETHNAAKIQWRWSGNYGNFY